MSLHNNYNDTADDIVTGDCISVSSPSQKITKLLFGCFSQKFINRDLTSHEIIIFFLFAVGWKTSNFTLRAIFNVKAIFVTFVLTLFNGNKGSMKHTSEKFYVFFLHLKRQFCFIL